jgi:hypothetical protein
MAMTPHEDESADGAAAASDSAHDAPERFSGRASVPGPGGSSSIRGSASVPGAAGRASAGWNGPSGSGGSGVYGGGAKVAGRPALVGKAKRRPRWGRIALVSIIALVVVGLVAGIGGYFYLRSIDSRIDRIDPFSSLTGGRPPKTARPARPGPTRSCSCTSRPAMTRRT